jgi:hypothetical protein
MWLRGQSWEVTGPMAAAGKARGTRNSLPARALSPARARHAIASCDGWQHENYLT